MIPYKNQRCLPTVLVCLLLATISCKFIQEPLVNEEEILPVCTAPACKPDEEEILPVCTPPACKPDEEYYCPDECLGSCGTVCIISVSEYYGCAFTVNIPTELFTDDMGWHVWFTPTSGEAGWVSVHAKKMPGINIETAFKQAADQYDVQLPLDPSVVESVTVIDYLDQPLQGLQADFAIGDDHIRLLVVVRSDTMLGDLAPAEVVYEIVAQTPKYKWEYWEPILDVIFNSFQPHDCGGV